MSKYDVLWKRQLTSILDCLRQAQSLRKPIEMRMSVAEFEDQGGDRKSYYFKIELEDGRVVNSQTNAVRSSLIKQIEQNTSFKNWLLGKTVMLSLTDKEHYFGLVLESRRSSDSTH